MVSWVVLLLFLSGGSVFPAAGLTDSENVKEPILTIYMKKYPERPPYEAGRQTVFSCYTKGGSPTPTFVWTVDGKPILNAVIERYDGSVQIKSRIDFRVDKNMDGGVLKCVGNNGVGNPLADTTTLHVLYPPDVSASVFYDNTQIVMGCSAKGNPNNYTYQIYYLGMNSSSPSYRIDDNISTPDISKLVLNNLTYEDTGHFFCSVANGIGVAQTDSVLVEPRSKPMFLLLNNTYETTVGSNLDIIFDLFSRPSVTIVEFKKYNADPDFVRNTLLEIPLKVANISLTLRSGIFELPGQRAMIRLDNVTVEESGNYSIIATNDQGSSAVFITILVKKIETPPKPGPVESGGVGAGIVILIIVILLNMIVLGALLYWRYRRMKPKRFVVKVHGDSRDTSKFLAGPDDIQPINTKPIVRQKKKSRESSGEPSEQEGHEKYAELDFSHVSKKNSANEVKRKDPPTEYAWIDFSRSTSISHPETSPTAS